MAVMTLTKDNFRAEVLESATPVLVDFWASWCGPCRMMSPIVDQIAGEASGVKVGKVNVDDEAGLAQEYGIMSIPTLLVFRGGKVAAQSVGVRPKEEILALLNGN